MKVSVLTVTFNSASTVEDTIRSVISQDHPDIEYIIVDGKSTDDTLQIVNKYRDHISLVISEKDNGMYDALNKGLKKCTGEVVAILNSDDFYVNNSVLSKVVKEFAKTGADAVYGNLQYVQQDDPQKVFRTWISGKYKHGMFITGWMPPHPAFFVKKVIYEKFGGFNTRLRSAADYELMLRFIHKHQIRLSYIPEILVKMRAGGMSNSSLLSRLKANREDKLAWELNDLKPAFYTFLFKPLRKIGQFLKTK